MRTTLTIDDDLAVLLRKRARELGVPFKEAVNRTMHAGLGKAASARPPPRPRPFRIPSERGRESISTSSASLRTNMRRKPSPRRPMILTGVNVLVHARNTDLRG
jgi:hypothetical protein